MRQFLRCLRADLLKTKRTPVRLAHLLIPVCVAGVFLAYDLACPWSEQEKIEGYYQVLGCAFPFLIGLFCVILAEQEQAAGKFCGMLSMTSKVCFIYSKLCLLLLLGIGAALLASLLFGSGFRFLLNQEAIEYDLCLEMALLLVGCSFPLYILHLFLAFRFNKGVSLGFGMMESLIAALLLTGLGEGIWMYVPPVWAARMTIELLKVGSFELAAEEVYTTVRNCVMVSVVGLVLLGNWFRGWEGESGSE